MRSEDFERLYSDHAPGLYSFLAYRTRDRALAEDLLADTYERVLLARRPFDRRKASEKTWIYSIALNLLRDHLRRRQAEERAVSAPRPRLPRPATLPRGHSGPSRIATPSCRRWRCSPRRSARRSPCASAGTSRSRKSRRSPADYRGGPCVPCPTQAPRGVGLSLNLPCVARAELRALPCRRSPG